jgi:hypothetical protein
MSDIKRKITDFVSFDISNDYYDETKKEEIIGLLKEILFEDDVTVRKFLEKLFSSASSAAKSYGLFTNQGDVEDPEEEISDEETEEETETEDEEETEEISDEEIDISKQESVLRKYISVAAKYLYE